ncbi:MAG: hypothetical protein IJ549_06455 [Prevotella sp.]|nr:hypothetical protein [Prevotella sp.]
MAIGSPVKSSVKNLVKKYHKAELVKANSVMKSSAMAKNAFAKDFVSTASIVKADEEPTTEEVETKGLVNTEYLAYLQYGGGFTDAYRILDVEYAIQDNKIDLQVDENIMLVGTIGEGENEYAEDGLEIITFAGGQVIGTSKTDNTDYVVKACDYNSTDHTITVNDNDIVAYAAFDEAGDISFFIIPEIIAVYNQNAGIIYGGVNYYYYPTDAIKPFIYNTYITGTTETYNSTTEDYDVTPVEIESQALFYDEDEEAVEQYILVKELNAWGVDDVWTKVSLLSDYSSAYIENYQYVGTYTFKDGSNGDIVNSAVQPDYYTDQNGLTLAVSSGDQGELVLTAPTGEDASIYWLVGFFDDGKLYLIKQLAEMQIVITSELTGIKGVTDNAKTLNSGVAYNLAGQKVGKGYKGLIIRDGKKYIVK